MPFHAIWDPPLTEASFNLDVSGIAGFFGGEESFAAMSSVHLMRGRKYMGWYNSPGSYYVAKKYGTLAKSRLWNGIFPGPVVEPAAMLELDSKQGPRYMGVFSGTRLPATGHLAYLLARRCETSSSKTASKLIKEVEQALGGFPEPANDEQVKGRKSRGQVTITIVKLNDFEKWPAHPKIPEDYFSPFDPIGIIASLCTIVAGIFCIFWGDWYSFAMIFLGGICNGVSCYVLGSGSLELDGPTPSQNSPPGDGVLINQRDIIILKGNEESVSNLIRGRFYLHYDSQPRYRIIGWSSVMLTLQFLLQLFLVPQGKLIGQIMFLVTFIISWAFNAYLASVDRETLQTDLLLKILGNPAIEKFSVDKWTTAAAFTTFYLAPKEPELVLDELLPNNTPAWNILKRRIIDAMDQDCSPTDVPRPLLKTDLSLDASGQKFVEEFTVRAHDAWAAAQRMRGRPGSVSPSFEKGRDTMETTIASPPDSLGKKPSPKRGFTMSSFGYLKPSRTSTMNPNSDSFC